MQRAHAVEPADEALVPTPHSVHDVAPTAVLARPGCKESRKIQTASQGDASVGKRRRKKLYRAALAALVGELGVRAGQAAQEQEKTGAIEVKANSREYAARGMESSLDERHTHHTEHSVDSDCGATAPGEQGTGATAPGRGTELPAGDCVHSVLRPPSDE